MGVQLTPYAAVSVLAGVGLVALTAYLLVRFGSRRTDPVVLALAGVTALSGTWAFASGMKLASVTLEAKLAWSTATYVGDLLPATWLVFTLLYTGRKEWVTRWSLAAVYGPSVVVVALVFAFGPTETIWASAELVHNGSFYVLGRTNETWYDVVVVYMNLLVVAGILVLYRWLYRSGSVYRGQAAALIVASLGPLLAYQVYVLGIGPHPDVDVTPLGFVVTGLGLTYAVVRYRLLDLVPVARASVIDSMRDGFLVLDDAGRIVDLNPAARAMVDAESPTGKPLSEVVPEYPATADGSVDADGGGPVIFDRSTADGTRHVEVRKSAVGDGGTLLLLQDVTERERRTEEIERTNERLELFAGAVSHDLRNPLAVAKGYAEQAKESPGPEPIEEVETALDRMEIIIDDVLGLAQSGETIRDTRTVDLETITRRAWNSVNTEGATLQVDGSVTFRADPEQASRIFENLFRNSVEHAGSDVAVRVGPLDVGGGSGGSQSSEARRATGGFYVADDGPGLPDDLDVFEAGVSTGGDGVGLGLAIVDEIATAHGWTATATDDETGGARFEFAGVEVDA